MYPCSMLSDELKAGAKNVLNSYRLHRDHTREVVGGHGSLVPEDFSL